MLNQVLVLFGVGATMVKITLVLKGVSTLLEIAGRKSDWPKELPIAILQGLLKFPLLYHNNVIINKLNSNI